MSVVAVQLGQCGNQIGTQLFSTLHEDARNAAAHPPSPLSSRPTGPLPASAYSETALERFFVTREKKAPQVSK